MACISLIICIRGRVRVRPTGYMCSDTPDIVLTLYTVPVTTY